MEIRTIVILPFKRDTAYIGECSILVDFKIHLIGIRVDIRSGVDPESHKYFDEDRIRKQISDILTNILTILDRSTRDSQ